MTPPGGSPADRRPGSEAAIAETLAPGTEIAGRYRLERFLARGGMGEVYAARDLALDLEVALKVIRAELADDPVSLRRLRREVVLARSVTHPSVCRIFDLGRHAAGGRELSFITMELLPGESLAARIRSGGRLTTDVALPLARDMAAALEAAHRAGVAHGDFKCANVMLVPGPDGERAVVTDFGLARPATADDPTASRAALIGTPAYMAPEQLAGRPASAATDIYAFGVVLFEMVTGRLPFAGDDLVARLLAATGSPPSPLELVPELDPRWERVIVKCLDREPERRFARAEWLATALVGSRRYSDHSEPTQAPPTPHLLPAERDPFFGRVDDLEELERCRQRGTRLVTLLGAAGSGKTRLAIRHGWATRADWPGGVWFTDLSEARSEYGVLSAVAAALGVPVTAGKHLVDQIGHAIAGRGRALFIFDNFEPVIDHADITLGQWLARAAEASVIVTSRERLRLDGEHVVSVGPLDATSALDLFAARARAQVPNFALDAATGAAAQRLVELLDGLPLAIELAAARVRLLSPTGMVERLRDCFQLLAGGKPGDRHATLRAAIDGSWEALPSWAKAAFAQLSVFEGGATLDAAEAVLDLAVFDDAPWPLDVLHTLVDRSLLRVWVPAGTAEPRFGMYASLHEYAREKLADETSIPGQASGPEAALRAERRHGEQFRRLGTTEAIEALEQHGGVERQRALAADLDNLVAGCRRAIARDDGGTAVATHWAAHAVFVLRGPFAAALELGRAVLAMPDLRPRERGGLLQRVAQATWLLGQAENARRLFGQALAASREGSDPHTEAMTLGELGGLHLDQGAMEEARTCLEQALAIHRAGHSRRLEGTMLCGLSVLHFQQGRVAEAHSMLERALVLHREFGDRRSEARTLANLAGLQFEQGRLDEANDLLNQASVIHQEVGDRRSEGLAVGNLGTILLAKGQVEAATEHFELALKIYREIGDRRHEETALGSLGRLYFGLDRLDEAGRHLEQSLAICREIGDRRHAGIALRGVGRLRARHGALDEARAAFSEGEQALIEVGDQIELGKLRCAWGEAEAQAGDRGAAAALLDRARASAAVAGIGQSVELDSAIQALDQTLRGSAEREH